MRALLYKDLCLSRKKFMFGIFAECLVAGFAAIALLGFTVGNFKAADLSDEMIAALSKICVVFLGGVGIFCSLNLTTVIDDDGECGWNKYQCAMPISVYTEVLSRYLLLIFGNTIMALCTAALAPLIFWSANGRFQISSFKLVVYIWLVGLFLALFRLPVEILFSAKTSTIIWACVYLGLGILFIISLMFIELEDIFEGVVKIAPFFYKNCLVWFLVLGILSFGIAVLGKRKHRLVGA